MKTIEEKAKAYDEIIERAKTMLAAGEVMYGKENNAGQLITDIIPELRESEDKRELRYCIEYINPCFPLLDNGGLNVRHLRVPDEHWAEMALTLILSFGGKIYALYRGNVKDGKLGEWPTPMIVEQEDWFTEEWLHSRTQ